MRCKNCGWNNPDSQTICEKCGSVLGAEPVAQPNYQPNHVQSALNSTVSEQNYFASAPVSADSGAQCPSCGYQVSGTMQECPNCGKSLTSANSVPQQKETTPSTPKRPVGNGGRFAGTVMPGQHSPAGAGIPGAPAQSGFCQLKRIAWQGEEAKYGFETFTGETIVLNRANTDPNNNTITSREQAVLSCDENGQWFIENRSEMKTTYIRVNGKTAIKDGDIIVLGNREFEFKG